MVKNSTNLITRDDIQTIARYLLVGDEYNEISADTKHLNGV
ncbi:hypothetical protein [Shewanella sp. MBTL60-007]|nr:hypothetical protein [Shewanella sp. MBTL60-007]